MWMAFGGDSGSDDCNGRMYDWREKVTLSGQTAISTDLLLLLLLLFLLNVWASMSVNNRGPAWQKKKLPENAVRSEWMCEYIQGVKRTTHMQQVPND